MWYLVNRLVHFQLGSRAETPTNTPNLPPFNLDCPNSVTLRITADNVLLDMPLPPTRSITSFSLSAINFAASFLQQCSALTVTVTVHRPNSFTYIYVLALLSQLSQTAEELVESNKPL